MIGCRWRLPGAVHVRGCRFCNAGMIYRPVRQRSVADLVNQAELNIRATGYDEISLVSLSTSDYSDLNPLMDGLHSRLAEKMVNISFPSLRPEKFTSEVAKYAKGVRKSGLTLAPEAGCQRLRDVINKTTTAEDLLRAVDLAFREGWNLVKLYFMIGQPTENDTDLVGIVTLVKKVSELARFHKGKRLNVSISPFVPKSVTPFQWVAQDSIDEINRKLDFLCSEIKNRNTKLSWRDAEVAAIEGVVARGDRRISRVIKRAWQLGAKFDGWSELFNFEYWHQALSDNGLDLAQLMKGFKTDAVLPWDHIDKGITKKFLKDEYDRSLGRQVTLDCRDGSCNRCGLMGQKACKEIINSESDTNKAVEIEADSLDNATNHDRAVTLKSNADIKERVARVKYRRGNEVMFLSHLDMLRMFERAMRRAEIPLVYTAGFNPRPKISYSPPLATGFTSDAEYFDVHYESPDYFDIATHLSAELPQGVEILKVKSLFSKSKSLSALINRSGYSIRFDDITQNDLETRISTILGREEIIVERVRNGKKGKKQVNIRPFIAEMITKDGGVDLQLNMDNGHSARIDEILYLLFEGKARQVKSARVNRTGLWIQYGTLLATPMEI